MKHLVAALLFGLTLAAVAQELPITEKLYQNIGEDLEAPLGGQVFKVVRRSTILNAFGKPDAFGRVVDRGFLELRYQGMTRDGKLVLRFIEVELQPDGTIVDRKRASTAAKGAKLPAGVTAYARDTAIPIAGKESVKESLPPNATEVAVDLSKTRDFRFSSITVTISAADNASIKYRLQQTLKAN